MGTTAEKLAYLKETKNQIKQALETPSNVMRDYANWIKKYVDNQPTQVVTDGVCTNALDVPLVRLVVDGNSYQGEEPSPDNPQDIEVIDGCNMIDMSKAIKNYYIKESSGETLSVPSSYNAFATDFIKVNQGDYIYYSGYKNTNSGNTGAYYDKDKNYLDKITKDVDIAPFIVPEGCKFIRLSIWGNRYETPTNPKPVLVKGTIPKPYLPYGHIGLKHTNEDGSKEEVIPINLNGNSIAKVGDVKDLLKIYRNGDVEIEKKTYKFLFENTRNVNQAGSSTTDYKSWYFNLPIKSDVTDRGNILSNCFKSASNVIWNNPSGYLTYLDANKTDGYFAIKKVDANSASKAKKFLIDNNVYFIYLLSEPETIKLPSINPIELWEGTNKFELITNLDTTFEMEYVINKNNILDEVQTAMLDAEIEI